MTDFEHETIEKNFKVFKRRHPFQYRKYKTYTICVIQLLDELDKIDELLTIDEDTMNLGISEKLAMELTQSVGYVVGLLKVWQKNSLFHPFQTEIVTNSAQTFVDCAYRTIQDSLNMTMTDLNQMIIEYLQTCKNDIVAEEIKDNGGYVDEDMDQFIMMHDDVRSDQLERVMRMRNEFTSNRLITRLQLTMFKNVIAYDYVEIMMGVDIIRERKKSSKETGQMIKRKIKFIDINELKGEVRHEFIKPRT